MPKIAARSDPDQSSPSANAWARWASASRSMRLAQRDQRIEEIQYRAVGDVAGCTLVRTVAPLPEPRLDEPQGGVEIAMRADKPLHVGQLALGGFLAGGG